MEAPVQLLAMIVALRQTAAKPQEVAHAGRVVMQAAASLFAPACGFTLGLQVSSSHLETLLWGALQGLIRAAVGE